MLSESESEAPLVLDLQLLDKNTVIRIPHDAKATRRDGKKHVEVIDPRTSVTMPTPGGELTLFFDPPLADGRLREVRLTPGAEPWRLFPRLVLYTQYARAVAAFREKDRAAVLRALQNRGSGVRGHGEDFYRAVAAEYEAYIAAGSSAPIKTIAESAGVTIAAASKWVKKARELGYIEEVTFSAS
jgi:hypothetical protein